LPPSLSVTTGNLPPPPTLSQNHFHIHHFKSSSNFKEVLFIDTTQEPRTYLAYGQ